MGEPSNVGVHTAGAALSSGVEDLVGTIWQWSDEFCDLHTCRGIVRGGSWCVVEPIHSLSSFGWLSLYARVCVSQSLSGCVRCQIIACVAFCLLCDDADMVATRHMM